MPTCLVFIGRQEECQGKASQLTDWLMTPWPNHLFPGKADREAPRHKDYDATFENARNAASGGVGGCHVQLCNFEVRGWDRPATTCYFDPQI